MGRSAGTAKALGVLSGIIAPIVGGWLLKQVGEGSLYLFAGLCIALSLSAIVLFKDFRNYNRVTFKQVRDLFQHKRDMIAFIGAGAENTIYTLAWPIILYLIFEDLMLVAIFSSVVTLVTAALDYWVGKKSDKANNEKLEKVGAMALSISWIGKATFQSPLALSIFDLVHKLLGGFRDLPLIVIAYKHARQDHEGYMLFRTISIRNWYYPRANEFFDCKSSITPNLDSFYSSSCFFTLSYCHEKQILTILQTAIN